MTTQLIAHLIGDYLLQSGWMANNKTKRMWPAFVHACVYSLPFFIMFNPSWLALFVIVSTHFVIDHWRVARYVVFAKQFLSPVSDWPQWEKSKATGMTDETPIFLSLWLMIIIDNLMHLIINTLALGYL